MRHQCAEGTLCAPSFGMALGIVWGLGVFLLGLGAWLFKFGTPVVTHMGTVYPGFKSTLLGAAIGGFWGLVAGFIGGLIFAWIYNFISIRCKRKSEG